MKKLILGVILLIAINTPASAAIFNEITSTRLNTEYLISGVDTHVDVVNGLEWLDFGDNTTSNPANNVSFGYSINNVVAGFAVDGFTLATETQVSNLFNFFFPTYVDNGYGIMNITENPASELIKERNSWLVSFGTDKPIGNGAITSDVFGSRGLYQDDDGSVQVAGFVLNMGTTTPETSLYSTNYTLSGLDRDSAFANVGVFMVRDYVPTVVPVPAAAWLMMSGLLGLIAVARRKA